MIPAMNSRFITLVRHAKSSWKIAGQTDYERELSDRGIRDAPVMANRLLERQCIPDLILCSSAVRTQQTAQVFSKTFGISDEKLRLERSLYLCAPETILEHLAYTEEGPEHIMIIGHNPGLEQLSTLMSPLCNPEMPTLGIRHFSCASFQLRSLGKQFQPQETDLQTDASPKIELIFEDFPKSAQ
jgi:phosphohistidine phosphatase